MVKGYKGHVHGSRCKVRYPHQRLKAKDWKNELACTIQFSVLGRYKLKWTTDTAPIILQTSPKIKVML
jgi:hypothetical protein